LLGTQPTSLDLLGLPSKKQWIKSSIFKRLQDINGQLNTGQHWNFCYPIHTLLKQLNYCCFYSITTIQRWVGQKLQYRQTIMHLQMSNSVKDLRYPRSILPCVTPLVNL
jgi:hypothetical protein